MTDAWLKGTLRLPPRVHVGFGVRQRLVAELPADSERVLAVIDPFLVGTPIWAQLRTLLEGAGRQVSVYSDITPELPVDSLTAAAADAADFGAQVIVAVGGGSALDAGKLIALLLAHGGPLSRYYGENRVPGPVLPVVALPTTAGTGSEVTPVAVIADSERELKVGVSSPYLVPAVALVDPELTMAAPASVTAFAGIDALVHAVESYTAAPFSSEAATDSAAALPVFTGRNVLTAGLSLQAAGRIHRWLPVAVRDGGDRRARAELSVGALQAGIAFGPTGTHLSHALQYPIGALTKTPHGLGTGLLLPYVLDILAQDAEAALRIGELGATFGVAADPGAVVAALVELNRLIGVPPDLAELGIERGQLPRIVELALQSQRLVAISPVPADAVLLHEILDNALAGTLTGGSAS
nr:iron-containing alcohol dehydrogenase [Microbacterium bovistercoris]